MVSFADKMQVLIVDDEPSSLNVLTSILREEFEIQIAKSGKIALEMVTGNPPDLILMDILMPEMTGYEVLAHLNDMQLYRAIPVIFITGLTGTEDEEKGLRLGAVDYITKPFKNEIVLARVRTHAKISRYIRAIERLGMIDALTDIPNRRHFDMRIQEEWRRMCRISQPVSMLMMDVDNFKIYNDTYGHPQGDLLLQAISKLFVSCLRRPSDLVARLGGEEFAVLLSGTSKEGAIQVAEHIRETVEKAVFFCPSTGKDTSITISIGVWSTIPSMERTVESFIQAADSRLYAAKSAGRNRVEY